MKLKYILTFNCDKHYELLYEIRGIWLRQAGWGKTRSEMRVEK